LPDGVNAMLLNPLFGTLHSLHYPWSAIHPISIPYYQYNISNKSLVAIQSGQSQTFLSTEDIPTATHSPNGELSGV